MCWLLTCLQIANLAVRPERARAAKVSVWMAPEGEEEMQAVHGEQEWRAALAEKARARPTTITCSPSCARIRLRIGGKPRASSMSCASSSPALVRVCLSLSLWWFSW